MLEREISEEDFRTTVIEYAQLQGWKVAGFRPARTEKGWRTPCLGDAKGYPDLTLVRNGQAVWAELKRMGGKLTEAQEEWLDALGQVDGAVSVYLWTPADWETIEAVLGREERG